MKKVGIVTRTSDRILLLERALKSIFEQTYKNWELVIVNDGANEPEIRILVDRVMSKAFNKVSIISLDKKMSFGAKINVGLESLNTEYCVVHDDDDSWDRAFLEKMVDFLEKSEHKEYAGVICHTDIIYEEITNGSIKMDRKKNLNRLKESELNLWNTLDRTQFVPISFLFRREVLEHIGYFSNTVNHSEDWEFYIRFLSQYKIGVVQEILAFYHIRKKVLTGSLANTVTVGENLHDLSKKNIRDQWLREDIKNSNVSLGLLGYLSNKIGEQEIQNRKLLQKIKEFQKIALALFVITLLLVMVNIIVTLLK